jgi:sugar/nucleoside kinase (ribokinase family)
LKTGIGIALTEPKDRTILTCPGSIDATHAEDVDETLLQPCRHWHIASLFLLRNLRTFWPQWFEKCRRAGARIEDFDLSLFDHQQAPAWTGFLTESTRARRHIVPESRVLSSELRR